MGLVPFHFSSKRISNILLPSVFGSGVFGTSEFGGSTDPMIRQTITGSGHAANLRIYSKDQKAAYSINGMYIDYEYGMRVWNYGYETNISGYGSQGYK